MSGIINRLPPARAPQGWEPAAGAWALTWDGAVTSCLPGGRCIFLFLLYIPFPCSLSLPQLVELALLVSACVLHEGIGTETMSLPLRPS